MHIEEHETDGTGYRSVQTGVSCMLTRFRVRSVWGLARAYWSYRQIRKEARQVDGLMVSLFLVENLHTYYTLSLWAHPRAILDFNTRVHAHVWAANSCFRDLEIGANGPQLWSAQFRLSAVSPHNLRWDGMELDAALDRPATEEWRHV